MAYLFEHTWKANEKKARWGPDAEDKSAPVTNHAAINAETIVAALLQLETVPHAPTVVNDDATTTLAANGYDDARGHDRSNKD